MKRLTFHRAIVAIAMMLIGWLPSLAHDFEVDGIYYNITSASDFTVEVTYKDNDKFSSAYEGSIVIPSSVSYNNHTLKVTSIGDYAFAWSYDSLTSIEIPNSVTSIGDYALSCCYSLTSIEIPNSVTSIGDFAFSSTNLTSIEIPNSVTSIGKYAFAYTNLTSIEIPNSVTSIGDFAFFSCTNLTSVTIPNSVSSINDNTFSGCSSITSVTIPNSITSIDDQAFQNCSSLTSVTIGSGVERIGEEAFNGCTSLTIINSLRTVFNDKDKYDGFDIKTQMEATLRIPQGSLAEYQSKDGWKEFWNIVEVENLEDVIDGTITTYNVNANYDTNQGSVTINGVAGTYAIVNANEKVEFEITPIVGYEIDKVIVNNSNVTADVVNGKYTIASATEDVTLEVAFKEQTFALVLKCSEAGAFKKKVKYGEVAELEILPSSNWAISSVTFNGTNITNELVDNIYTTPAITSDSELNVVFVNSGASVYSVYNTSDVVVSASQQTIKIKGLEVNTTVAVYNTNGQLCHSAAATDYEMNINMGKEGVYLVKVGERTFKVIL